MKWIEDHPGTVLSYEVDCDIRPPGQRDGFRRSLRSIVEEHLRKKK
jgi:hypothetical protein